ncbi:MAG: flagellar motor protein MotB, partial [Bacteroidota bacterium]
MRIVFTFISLLLVFGCSFVEKIKDGETAYDRKQYAIASKMLIDEYESSNFEDQKGRKAFLIGECYHHMNDNKNAVQWYAKSYKHKYGNVALKKLAFALKKDEQYERAFKSFDLLMQEEGNSLEYRREATACQQAADWRDNIDKNEYEVDLTSFNSANAEYAPFVFGADQILFTSDRKSSTGDSKYQWTGNDYSDIFITNKNSSSASLFDQVINTESNEGTIVFSKDREVVYFTRCDSEGEDDSYCKLMTTRRKGNRWLEPLILPFTEENVNYGHPALSSNDSILFFSSNHPDGKGGYDIYFSKLTNEGWQEPVNLGDRINTLGDEKFPSIHNDTMYFSSDRHIGMGGLDIFKTYVDEYSEQWTPPLNLRAPINSGGDDFAFVVDEFSVLRGRTIQKGFFTSSRTSGMGNDDIYSFEKSRPIKDPTDLIADPDKDKDKYEIYLVCKVV